MAFLVVRKDGRYEIRESVATAAGPRARTLATFRQLDDGVLDRATARATGPFDRAAIEARAEELGVPRNVDLASRLARALITELRNGRKPAPALTRILRDELPRDPRPTPDTIAQALEWIGRSDASRGEALVDLLSVADRLPSRAHSARSEFPRIDSRDSGAADSVRRDP